MSVAEQFNNKIIMQISVQEAFNQLKNVDTPFAELFKHGTLSIEIYQPVGQDMQTPHSQDEVYIVISGTGEFINGTQKTRFQPGDCLFVPAGVTHRFVNFSDDFATWVIFYGPEGGEKT